MKKDIPVRKVDEFAIAILPAEDQLWDVYLLNLRDLPIRDVFISSRGYGERNDQRIETTRLRYYFAEVDGHTAAKIEPIQTELFDLAHEYWVSFRYDGFMFDKKYVFVPYSISSDYFTQIPLLEARGVMIK